MPAPFNFPTVTANLGLPLLFAGQAQKEFFVNQALAVIDGLLQHGIVASLTAPPIDAVDGQAYRVLGPASGDWTGEEESLAVRIGGAWHFVSPADGMIAFDRQTGQFLVYQGQWEAATTPPEPTGGTVVDVEARAAITALIGELERIGLLA